MIGLQLEQEAAAVRKQLLFEHGIFTGSASEKYDTAIATANSNQPRSRHFGG
ncbi:MAG: hypothetical protein R2795_23880 [Saprospiraceae bacterium]